MYKYLAFNKKGETKQANAEERKQKKSNDRAGKEPSTQLDKSKHNRDLGTKLGTKRLRKMVWRNNRTTPHLERIQTRNSNKKYTM